jgi:hypothetical protein
MEPRTSSDPPLTVVGQLIIGLVFAVGVALMIFTGLYVGAVIGVTTGVDVMNNTPTQPVGMAPDLTPLVKGALQFGLSAFLGAVAGLAVGAAAMTAVCGWLLAPLLRRVSASRG